MNIPKNVFVITIIFETEEGELIKSFYVFNDAQECYDFAKKYVFYEYSIDKYVFDRNIHRQIEEKTENAN